MRNFWLTISGCRNERYSSSRSFLSCRNERYFGLAICGVTMSGVWSKVVGCRVKLRPGTLGGSLYGSVTKEMKSNY
jgi:hypothetical protein